MATVYVDGKKINCETGEILYRVLLRSGIQLDAPCGGNGTCGKCLVTVDGAETVQSCRYAVTRDIHVTIPKGKEGKIAETGRLRPVEMDCAAPGIAVDIGTTTVVVYLISEGKIVDIKSALNCQKPFGDDVLSRIKYTSEQKNGLAILSKEINRQIQEMAAELCEKHGVQARSIIVAGNTVMLHLFAGISPASIGVAPFTPVFTELKRLGNITLLPSISGYVGADTVAAILASGIHLCDEMCLLVDIGTNGEIALGNKEKITVCAAAAGPAFEGAQIRCGMGGVAGAVNRLKISDNGAVTYTTIGQKPPVGICGSGILDAISEMLRTGLLDESGYFEDGELNIAPGVVITDSDVRQVQLAKAAIAAGIYTLLEETGTPISSVKHCYLAGGFGSYLNKNSACTIGLLPKELLHKIQPIGNAAGMGAVLFHISSQCKREISHICKITDYLELSQSSVFNRQFTACMGFE